MQSGRLTLLKNASLDSTSHRSLPAAARRPATRAAGALVCAFLACGAASADVVVMLNGDTITGDISRIWDNDLTIEPEYADEFSVDLDQVRYIESDEEFEITLADGREVTAALRPDDDGNQLVVVDDEPRPVALTNLIEVEEPDEYFDWSSNIDWSSVVREGNTDSETTRFNVDATVSIGDHRHITNLTLNDESQNDVKTKDQDLLTYSYNWLFGTHWFAGGNASYERDPIRDLNRRALLGGGLGRDIWNLPDRTMNFEFGLGRQSETIGGVNDENDVAYWIYRFSYELADTDLEFFHDHRVTNYLSGRDNTIVKSTTGTRYEITDLFYLTVSLDYDYESAPAPGNEKKDTSLVVGAGFEF